MNLPNKTGNYRWVICALLAFGLSHLCAPRFETIKELE